MVMMLIVLMNSRMLDDGIIDEPMINYAFAEEKVITHLPCW